MKNQIFIMVEKPDFDRLMEKVNDIHSKIDSGKLKHLESTIDNDEFIKLMKISKRTAQAWRDEGVIAFHQYKNSIYYKMEDIEDFMQRNRRPTFKLKK